MKKKRTFGYVEIVFDVLYLCTVLGLGLMICLRAVTVEQILYAGMAFVLVFGDAFHLIPRIASASQKDKYKMERLLGVGKMVTSVGMTVFYFLLWVIGIRCFSPNEARMLTLVVIGLVLMRVILTILPQNRWDGEGGKKWSVYRNIPFIILGGMTALLYWRFRDVGYDNFTWMWLAIGISFACYLPVVFWVKHYPILGMLMLPKSCAYVWMIAMGLSFMGKS